jgi:hypothetical protein
MRTTCIRPFCAWSSSPLPSFTKYADLPTPGTARADPRVRLASIVASQLGSNMGIVVMTIAFAPLSLYAQGPPGSELPMSSGPENALPNVALTSAALTKVQRPAGAAGAGLGEDTVARADAEATGVESELGVSFFEQPRKAIIHNSASANDNGAFARRFQCDQFIPRTCPIGVLGATVRRVR